MSRPSFAPEEVRSRLRSAAPFLYGAAVFLLLLAQWKPLFFSDGMPEPWVLVLSEAAAGRYGFGTDVVFTHGPLSDIYTRLFNPGTFASVLTLTYGLIAVQTIAFATLARRAETPLFPLLLGPALFFVMLRDVPLLVTPLLFALASLGRPTGRQAVALSVVGAIASAISTLVKFSLFPLSIGLFLLVDLNRLRLKSLPIATLCYGVAFYLSFLLIAPAGSDFLLFLSGSIETSAGYSAAMSVHGFWFDVAIYAALIIATIAALAAIERRQRTVRGGFGWEATLSLLALALFLWITFKIGFVRQDLHVLTGYGGLSLGLCAYGISRLSTRGLGRPAAVCGAVILVSGFYGHVRLAVESSSNFPMSSTLRDALAAAPSEIARTVHAVANPRAWLAERHRLRDAARAAMARTSPVIGLDGTVDSLPQMQSVLLTAGLDYRPRPTIQEYTTYTRALIERNRAFLTGATAPDYFVFESYGIDDRYPAFSEGPLWPLFLSRYAPSFEADDTLILRRRAQALGDLLLPAERGVGRLGLALSIPFGDEPLFVSIDVHPTVLGRVAEFLFKPPLLYLGVTLRGGQEQFFRFIPAIAREGFIASPFVKTSTDFVLLAAGARADEIRPVTAMRIVGEPGSDLAYSAKVTYTVRKLDRAKLAEARNWPSPPGRIAAVNRARALEAVRSSEQFKIVKEGLFAHPPSSLSVDVAGMDGLRVGFGMLAESWSGGGTSDGVCFRVLDGGGSALLWERCLAPLKAEEDRMMQQATIDLPSRTDRIVLKTDCRTDCRWDWAYWSDIAPVRR